MSESKDRSVTRALFVEGPTSGVPSLLSNLDFPDVTASSRTGRTTRSAYFLHPVPQLSHIISLDRPLGAFHHVVDSRVLHAAQVGGLEGCSMVEPSSSERPTLWPSRACSGLSNFRCFTF